MSTEANDHTVSQPVQNIMETKSVTGQKESRER